MKALLSKLINFLILKEQYMLLILFILVHIKEKNNGREKRFFSSPLNKITILALDSNRYRGDLDILSSHAGIRVLTLSQRPLGWLIKPFYNELNILRYVNAERNSDDANSHKKAYNFMREFLRRFYKHVSVDCVTTVNYRYLEDFNWTKASDRLGVPFIMLYRECLLASDIMYDKTLYRTKQYFGKFLGSYIIVHNDICKQMLVDSGYVSYKKISTIGALRMDIFLKLIRDNKNKERRTSKKTFIFFYFSHDNPLFGREKKSLVDKSEYRTKIWNNRDKFFIDLHNAIIELAVEHPEINFIIKPKKEMIENKSWNFYENIVKGSRANIKNISNYKVDCNLNISKNLVDSSSVCAFQSSVMVEAAIANKRVIVPMFYDFSSTPYFNDFFWKDDLDLFDVATSKSEFKRLFRDVLNNPVVSENIQRERVILFDKWFNSTRGDSLDKYYNKIKSIVQ